MEKKQQNKEERIGEFIKSYQELLEEKGYHEAALNNGVAPGTLSGNIEKAFRDMAAISLRENDAMLAIVKTAGRLGKDQETVIIDFLFGYEGTSTTIKLSAIIAETHDLKIKITTDVSSAIPDLNELAIHIQEARLINASQQRPPKKISKGKRM